METTRHIKTSEQPDYAGSFGRILKGIQGNSKDREMLELIQYPISRSAYNRIKNGHKGPRWAFVVACVKALNIGDLTLNEVCIDDYELYAVFDNPDSRLYHFIKEGWVEAPHTLESAPEPNLLHRMKERVLWWIKK